jgi:hypothetical protein
MYMLALEGNRIVMKKGIFLPYGFKEFIPPDKQLAEIYKPVWVPEDYSEFSREKFDSLVELDRRLFTVLINLAKEMIEDPDEDAFIQGKDYLSRAAMLVRTDDERKMVDDIMCDASYRDGKMVIENIERQLKKALGFFRRVKELDEDRYEDIEDLISMVEEKLRLFSEGVAEEQTEENSEQGRKKTQKDLDKTPPPVDRKLKEKMGLSPEIEL